MERRNRSLEALKNLYYIDSLDSHEKAVALEKWVLNYLNCPFEEGLDLKLDELKQLSELFYKNILFLKQHTVHIKQELDNHDNIKKFFS